MVLRYGGFGAEGLSIEFWSYASLYGNYLGGGVGVFGGQGLGWNQWRKC